ncbi:ZIP family metal transporter [Patescibacteria group bacterium]|nr:ZIP family metal transporter [Patescibacteria group bacterium]
METFFWIILSTFLISLIAFVGALALFLKERLLDKILLIFVAFSAGALIGGAFFHLIPEAIARAGINQILNTFFYLIFGFCLFFVLEQFIGWHHHHTREHPEIMPFSYLILISDAVHNFIDGLIIAASFVIGFPIGAVTALVVALHEIPQEIGDFGVLVYGGFKKGKALFLNFISGTTVVFGGIFGFLFAEKIGDKTIFLLPFAAGTFIYIACSDLIPEIKREVNIKNSLIHFFVFLAGIGLMLIIKLR